MSAFPAFDIVGAGSRPLRRFPSKDGVSLVRSVDWRLLASGDRLRLTLWGPGREAKSEAVKECIVRSEDMLESLTDEEDALEHVGDYILKVHGGASTMRVQREPQVSA